MLHDIPVKSYCGPAALMAVTGLDLPPVRAALNKAAGKRENAGVLGVTAQQVLDAVTALGYTHDAWVYWNSTAAHKKAITRVVDMKRPTLTEFAEMVRTDKVFIIAVTGHLVAMYNGMVYDSWARYGEHYSESRWKRCRVGYAMTVKKVEA